MQAISSRSRIFRTYNLISPRKRIFQQTILACLSGAQVDSIHGGEKIPKISRDTTTLNDELLWSKTKNTYK